MPYKDANARRAFDRARKRRQASARQGGRAESVPSVIVLDGVAGPVRLRRADDLIEILEDEIGRFRKSGDSTPSDRLRTVGYALGVASRLLEVGPIEQRIAALETMLGELGEKRRRFG